ncbi:MAG TPA: gliding motility-associated C-terminal domain-containing protein, partial [Cyclobacteriaceae bacterium]|nr:gliding motility-associated C-terminal domain-containing protein [Cyclobacteriaceae bacterium]
VGGCNNTPQLLVPPIDQGCTGVRWTHNPGAWDPDGDSLSYSLYIPKQGGVYNADGLFVSGIDVGGYNDPNAQQFYSSNGIPYSTANELGNGPPIFKIDPLTGTITWDAPGRAGEYNIAFIIKEWRRIPGTSTWVSLGYVERDMQIVIQDCKNNRPKLTVPPDVCVTAGTKVTADIFAVDPAVVAGKRTNQDGDSTKIEGFSDVFNTIAPLATITPGPSVWQVTIGDTQQAHVQFNWQTTCSHVKEQPYEVVFKATDNGAPPLASFESWKIRVVAPAPIWNSATLNANQRAATLTWKPYTCSNALVMQVWRKVDSTPFTPPQCVTGMPDYLGYTLINTVAINKSSYVDQSLAIGAKYCYRLVAVFPNAGGESYVSDEICLPPILADAPVVTNVTIDVTDTQVGQVTVRWTPPFDVDKTQFPPPYTYVVKRADGFSGIINLKTAHPGQLTDTTFTDTGLNTTNNVYNYRIFCYDKTGGFVDTSAVASTVRLELKPLTTQIELTWNAIVPWTNTDANYPMHWIYRSTNTGSKLISDLTAIDSVNVSQHVFSYLDSGQYNKTPLVKTQDYCYAVMTKGSYGNPKIKAPLKNFSEITCINLTASEPPCKPSFPVTLTGIDCNNFNSCPVQGSAYSNTIRWVKPTDVNCQKDIKGYNVYSSNSMGDTFTLLATMVTDTFYVHSGLTSFAQCYKVSAVNRAGIESDLSDQFCFDNCPYYELPNVFTPNGDACNDKFSAYNVRYYTEKGWPCGSNPEVQSDSIHYANVKSKCARFVLAVTFTVYNRWGREVYKYEGRADDDVSTIYIDWDGKDSQGRDLDAGVYYYSAAVVFDVVDPKRRNRTIKGWVQLIR